MNADAKWYNLACEEQLPEDNPWLTRDDPDFVNWENSADVGADAEVDAGDEKELQELVERVETGGRHRPPPSIDVDGVLDEDVADQAPPLALRAECTASARTDSRSGGVVRRWDAGATRSTSGE